MKNIMKKLLQQKFLRPEIDCQMRSFSKLVKNFIYRINVKLNFRRSLFSFKLDVDPQRDDDASPMSTYRCLLRPT